MWVGWGWQQPFGSQSLSVVSASHKPALKWCSLVYSAAQLTKCVWNPSSASWTVFDHPSIRRTCFMLCCCQTQETFWHVQHVGKLFVCWSLAVHYCWFPMHFFTVCFALPCVMQLKGMSCICDLATWSRFCSRWEQVRSNKWKTWSGSGFIQNALCTEQLQFQPVLSPHF